MRGKVVYQMPAGPDRSAAWHAQYFSDFLWNVFCAVAYEINARHELDAD